MPQESNVPRPAVIPPMCKRLFPAAAVLAIAGCLTAAAQTLTWDPNSETDLAGYRVYGGAANRNYTLVVDVGKTTSYTVRGLDPGTWCFAVTAYNTAGLESGFSEEVCAPVGIDSTPPVLMSRATRVVTNEGASIAWATGEPAAGTVEYGVTTEYGSVVAAAGLATAQSVRLSGLAPATTYHYRIIAKDSSGNSFVTQDGTFATAPRPSTIVSVQAAGYPRPVCDTPLVGLGLTNSSAVPSVVRLTPFDPAGAPMGEPVALLLAPGEQVLALDGQIFGDGIAALETAWVKVESSTAGTTGLFFGLDDGPTKMDGGTLQWGGLNEFILPGSGRVSLLNPHPDACSARVELMARDGTVLDTVNRVIPGNGALATSAGLLFPGTTDTGSGYYLRVGTTLEVFSFAAVRDTSEALALVPGLDARRFLPALYAPDFIGGDGWHSTITVMNTEGLPGSFTARLFADDGTPVSEAITYRLPGRGSIEIPDTELIPDPGKLTRGYVEISTNVALTGMLTIEFSGEAASAFRLIEARQQSLVIGQVASDSAYYTGAALLNPGPEAASVTLELHLPDGTLLDTWSGTLGPRQRVLKLMTQYFPDLVGKEVSAGYVKVVADRNIAVVALFGRNDLTALSAIPPD